MKEYISVDLLKMAIEAEPYFTDSTKAAFRNIVNKVPPAKVIERKRGEWEVHPQDTFAREHHCEKLRCKHCWHFFYHNYGDSKLYCPNCGADMREVDHDQS